jgi:hypothetical protein
MTEEFVKNLLDFAKSVPSVRDGALNFMTFSIIYEKEKPGHKNVLLVRYQMDDGQVEILVQSPKETVLGDAGEKELKSVTHDGKKFFTNFDPKLEGFFLEKADFYTTINGDEVITIRAKDSRQLKLVDLHNRMKFDQDILAYAGKFSKEFNGFELCMTNWSRQGKTDKSRMIFLNTADQSVISAEIVKDRKAETDSFLDAIVEKKKLEGDLFLGKMEGHEIVFTRLDENRIFMARTIEGENAHLHSVASHLVGSLK